MVFFGSQIASCFKKSHVGICGFLLVQAFAHHVTKSVITCDKVQLLSHFPKDNTIVEIWPSSPPNLLTQNRLFCQSLAIFLGEKPVAPLIAAPSVDNALEDNKEAKKSRLQDNILYESC